MTRNRRWHGRPARDGRVHGRRFDPDRWDPNRWDPERWDRERWERRRRPHPLGFVILLALVQVFGTRAAAYGGGDDLDRLGYILLIAGPAALVLRGRLPLLSLIGALVPTVWYFAVGYPVGPGFLAALVAMFTALSAGYRWLTWLCVAVAYAVFAVLSRSVVPTGTIVLIGVWCLVIAGFGEAARVRGVRYSEIVKARLQEQQRVRAEEERARVEQQRRQASDERLRVARELHDVLGHHLSLINVQAGVGLHLMDERPEQARAALAAIKHASAEALRETRSVLAALNPDGSAPRAPAHGLADLDALVAEVTAAGLPVTVRVDGTPRTVPAEVDRAAYRIIQEALTNVRRHAGTDAKAEITVGYAPTVLLVEILDDGGSPHDAAPDGGSVKVGADGGADGGPVDTGAPEGNGLSGMRHRALILGGSVEAGFRAEGGFSVSARLPIPKETLS